MQVFPNSGTLSGPEDKSKIVFCNIDIFPEMKTPALGAYVRFFCVPIFTSNTLPLSASHAYPIGARWVYAPMSPITEGCY